MSGKRGPLVADIRIGCVAVYPDSEEHSCLDGITDRLVHFKAGKDTEEGCVISEQIIADAYLFAAAPELLAALENLLKRTDSYFGHGDQSYDWKEQEEARAAIAKTIVKETTE